MKEMNRIVNIFFVICTLALFCIASCVYAGTDTEKNNTVAGETEKNNAVADENENYYSYLNGEANGAEKVKDPYEKFNRVMFNFNEKVDKYVLKPAAKGYNKVVPKFISNRVGNFFRNLGTLPTIVNDLLQGNFYQATSDSWHFVINSTVGVGGLFDFAPSFGLPDNDEDFGLTLAKWGYVKSNYLVLPFLGSSTVRGTLALPVDYATSFYPYVDDSLTRNSMVVIKVVDKRAQLLRFQETYQALAIDRYILMRSAYLQKRNYLIKRNKNLDDPYTPEDMEKSETNYYLDE